MAHDLAVIQSALVRHVDMNTNLQAGLQEAKDQLAGSDRRLKEMTSTEARVKAELTLLRKENEELREKDEGLRKENEELRSEAQGIRATLTARESRLVELMGLAAGNQTKLDHTAKLLEAAEGKKKTAETWATAAEGRASAAEKQGSILQKELSTTREELSTARGELSTTREELHAARGESSTAREELSTARAESSTAREELSTARAELTKALEAAVQAVAAYKESKEFEVDAALACVDLYKIGYTDCLLKVREGHPDLDLSQVAREVEDEEGEEEEEEEEGAIDGGAENTFETDPVDDQSAPGEDPPAIPLPSASVPVAEASQADEGPKGGGLLAGTSKSADSGNDASEPIIVESPEPDRDQQLPMKEL